MDHPSSSTPDATAAASIPPHLPTEVLLQIVTFLLSAPSSPSSSPTAQHTLSLFALVSRSWYDAAVVHLYRAPRLASRNFDLFVRTLCLPPRRSGRVLHPRSTTTTLPYPQQQQQQQQKTRKAAEAAAADDLAALVRELDLSALVHEGRKSTVARLLGRTGAGVEELRAPMRGFAVNSLAALAKYRHLRTLDLSLVSERLPVQGFLRAVERLECLLVLRLPRAALTLPPSSAAPAAAGRPRWPAALKELHATGGLALAALAFFPPAPWSLECFGVDHIAADVLAVLLGLVDRDALLALELGPNVRDRGTFRTLDGALAALPSVRHLSVPVATFAYDPRRAGDDDHDDNDGPVGGPPFPHPLETLVLTAHAEDFDSDQQEPLVANVVDMVDDGRLPLLRKLSVSRTLARLVRSGVRRRDLGLLSDLLEALERERVEEDAAVAGQGASSPCRARQAGVFLYAGGAYDGSWYWR